MKALLLNKQETDHDGPILILDVSINDSKYTVIKIYIANTKKQQIEVLSNLYALIKTFYIDPNKHLIMAGVFHLFFNSKLDGAGGNPTLKGKSLAKLIKLKEAYDLCDTCRIRNAKKQNKQTNKNNSLLLNKIYLVLFNTDLITYLFRMVFKIYIRSRYSKSYFNRSSPCAVLSFKGKR